MSSYETCPALVTPHFSATESSNPFPRHQLGSPHVRHASDSVPHRLRSLERPPKSRQLGLGPTPPVKNTTRLEHPRPLFSLIHRPVYEFHSIGPGVWDPNLYLARHNHRNRSYSSLNSVMPLAHPTLDHVFRQHPSLR
ncbi:hypothetical protein DL93DRAFT_1973519 [Clavulina sp. PMI_390]|nr:hypothetical protein DL93DRAFT_1973519 [Clavulina sp. PMI_390]